MSSTRQRYQPLRLQRPNTWGSTTTSPLMIRGIASTRLHHHGDLATMRLHHRDDSTAVSTSFCVLPHDMQDYDFKVRLESLPDSTTRLDTRGLLTRTRPIRSSCLGGIPGSYQGRNPLEEYMNPTRPNTPTWSRRQETHCKR
jgi:hypothetical protein